MKTSSFSDRQLAGQRLMVGFNGTALDDDLSYLIDTLKVGGVILFSRNLADPEQIKQLTGAIQRHARACGQPPLFVSIDQEGGEVTRLKPPFTKFPGNPSMRGEDDADRFAAITASELAGVGINMNMAPVLDVAPADIDSVMARRVFGHDPQWVTRLGMRVIDGLQQRRIMAVAKHFPGIGRTVLDSHLEMPNLDVDIADLEAYDLIPFYAAVSQDAAGIMLSHIRYRSLDGKWPASLSVRIAKDLLRDRMGYDGLVMTDDLDMGAIEKHYRIRDAIERILLSGIDIAMVCHRSPNIETAFETILSNLQTDAETRARGVAAVERIMRFKEKFGLSIP